MSNVRKANQEDINYMKNYNHLNIKQIMIINHDEFYCQVIKIQEINHEV